MQDMTKMLVVDAADADADADAAVAVAVVVVVGMGWSCESDWKGPGAPRCWLRPKGAVYTGIVLYCIVLGCIILHYIDTK